MKKVILSSIFALALIATTGYGVNRIMNSDANLSDLALANVEALANGEDFTITCGQDYGRCMIGWPGRWPGVWYCVATGDPENYCYEP